MRRVRFVGAGATARLLGFHPGQLVTTDADLTLIEDAFSGRCLTHGVKMQRSHLARVPAAPIRAVVTAVLATAGLDADVVFSSRDASNWWRAVDRAGTRDRSVSFLTASGVLSVLERRGMGVNPEELHAVLGSHLRATSAMPVDARRRGRQVAVAAWTDARVVAAASDVEIGAHLWIDLAAASARREPVGNAGYELTLTLPKSFSLHALAGDESMSGEWLDAMEVAATRALELLMAEAGFCSTGHRGDGEDVSIMPADGWAGFIATEISSRAGDPHLPVHCTLPNQLVGADGLVRTMADGGRELIINAPRFAAWGQAFVIEEATSRGLIDGAWFHPGTRQWEIGGFADDTIATFSQGRLAVLSEIAESDDGSARDVRGRSRRDRAAKARVAGAKGDEQPSWSQVRGAMLARASTLGLDVEAERTSAPPLVRQPYQWSDDEWVEFVSGAVCEHESTVSLARIRALIDLAACGVPVQERSRITSVVLKRGFVRAHESRDTGMRTGGQRWVSAAALDAETRLLAAYDAGLAPEPVRSTWRTASGIDQVVASSGWMLSDEQANAVTSIIDGHDHITLVSGVAGSGKTTVLAAAHRGLTAGRRPGFGGILVTSTATIAASAAGDASGAPWMNIAALLARIDAGLRIRGSVVVVDEASMVDVGSLARLADWCGSSGKRLVLQGDERQLRAVGAGDAFNVLCGAHPDRVVRLTENRRQRTDVGRGIAAALHARDVDAAWQQLTDTDAVLVARHREHKLQTVAGAVVEAITKHGARQVTCDAVTNAEVDELNARIHARLIDTGGIDPSTVVLYRTVRGDRALGTGTLLRVNKPTSGPGERLVRGDRARVLEAGRDRIRLVFDDGRQRTMTPRMLFAHLDYGYAGTTHKVQGQTSAVHIASLDRNKDLASLYVSATRGRERTVFVADARDWLTDTQMRDSLDWPTGQLDDEVLDRVHAHLSGKTDNIDSPREHMRPTWAGTSHAGPRPGIGMAI